MCHALYQVPGYLPKALATQKHNAKGHIRKINIQYQYPINLNFSAVFGHEVLLYKVIAIVKKGYVINSLTSQMLFDMCSKLCYIQHSVHFELVSGKTICRQYAF